jgi:hypothetical protein
VDYLRAQNLDFMGDVEDLSETEAQEVSDLFPIDLSTHIDPSRKRKKK